MTEIKKKINGDIYTKKCDLTEDGIWIPKHIPFLSNTAE